MNALHAVLAVVLLVSAAFGAVAQGPTAAPSGDISGTASAQMQASNQSIHVLDIPPSAAVRSTVGAQHIDLGPAVGFAEVRTGGRLQSLTSVERIESASDESRRQQLILGEINRIEQRAIALRSAQQNAIEAYNAGESSPRELLVELARIDAEARHLDARRVKLRELAADTPDFSVDSGRLAALERQLGTFTGPVRGYAADVLSGEEPPTRFYVRTSASGVVLSVVADDTYVRESYRADLRNQSSRSVTPTEALDVVAESYPAIWDRRDSQNGADVVGSGNSYLVRINHGDGKLAAYVDSGSGKVFKEWQTVPLDGNETVAGPGVTEVKDGLRLTVNRTFPGGPLRIQLNESATGDPVDANVTVGLEASRESTLLGRTGADGTIWTVSPPGRFTVTVIKGNAAVVLTVSPAPIPYLATNGTTPNGTNGTPNGTNTTTGATTPPPTAQSGADAALVA